MSRQSVYEPNNPIDGGAAAVDGTGDYQAVDDTPGVFAVLCSLGAKIWWAFVIVAGCAAISFPYFFPEWADRHKNALVEMGIVANSVKFFENAKSVEWSEALSAENIAGLYLVGTGRHPQLKADPGLKAGAWYMGNGVFIMKEPVPYYAYLNFLTDSKTYKPEGDGLLPASNVEYDDARLYCASIGGRIPTLPEMVRAYRLAFTKAWQGATGNFLKPNLVFRVSPEYSLWTSTSEDTSYLGGDNFAVYTPGADSVVYEDDGYNDRNLSFLCAMDAKDVKKE